MPKMTQDDRLIYLISTAQHRLRMRIKDELLAAGVKITLVQAGILFLLLQKNGQAMSNLSRLLSLDNSTVTGLVDRLEKAGYLRRGAKSDDRRVSLIHITPQGKKEAEKAGKVIKKANEYMKTGFSEEELEAFKKVLNELIEKLAKD